MNQDYEPYNNNNNNDYNHNNNMHHHNNKKNRQQRNRNCIPEDNEIDFDQYFEEKYAKYSHKLEIRKFHTQRNNNMNNHGPDNYNANNILNSTNLRKFNQLTKQEQHNRKPSHFSRDREQYDDQKTESENDYSVDQQDVDNHNQYTYEKMQHLKISSHNDQDDNYIDEHHENENKTDHDNDIQYGLYQDLQDALDSIAQLKTELNALTDNIHDQESENKKIQKRIQCLQQNEIYESNQQDTNNEDIDLYSDHISINKNTERPTGNRRKFGGIKRRFNDAMDNDNDDAKSVNKRRRLQYCG